MPQKPLIQIPEYLKYFKFIVDKNTFSSSDFIEYFSKDIKVKEKKYKKGEHTIYYKEIQKWSKILQNFKNADLVISQTKFNKKKNKNEDSKGGRSGHYQDNSNEFFFNNYFLPNFNFNSKNKFTKKEVEVLFLLFQYEKGNFLLLDTFDLVKIKKSKSKISNSFLKEINPSLEYYSKAKTIDELFKLISDKIMFIISKKGLNDLTIISDLMTL